MDQKSSIKPIQNRNGKNIQTISYSSCPVLSFCSLAENSCQKLSKCVAQQLKKKGSLLFDYACHSCSETMLIFSVYISVCLMSDPRAGHGCVCCGFGFGGEPRLTRVIVRVPYRYRMTSVVEIQNVSIFVYTAVQ